MSAPVLTMSALVMCAHGGKVVLMPNSKVLLSGTPAALGLPVLPVAGCPILTTDVTVMPLPIPSYTTRVLSNGMPLLLQTIIGMPVASGAPLQPCMLAGQTKVIAS